MPSPEHRAAREHIVLAHIDAENRHDVAATVATFAHARYEIIPTGDTYDDHDAVTAFHEETRSAFPDFQVTLDHLHHADHAVIGEVTFHGTHLGAWRGLPATGRAVSYAMCGVFIFEGDRLVCERVYFDLQTVLRQVGIARDPTSVAGRVATVFNHPLTLARALLRRGTKGAR